jgi:5-methylcytosine-specific restriction enzyme subunit McrC
MNIPIKNIYYLLAYGWDRLEQAGVIRIDEADFKHVADLFASVLSAGVRRVLKRGLDHGYREVDGLVRGIRGKIQFDESIRRTAFQAGRAYCLFDELSSETVLNRVVAQTLRNMVGLEDLDAALRSELRECIDRMGCLAPIRLTASTFSRVQMHGNNASYAFLIEVCRLVSESIAVDESNGRRRFRDFLRDEGPMARLFERFVYNFYRREQCGLTVGNRVLKWAQTEGTAVDLAMLPSMRTDVFLSSSTRRVIVDAKYYRSPLQSNYRKDTVRSGHLYQLYAYVRNLELIEPGPPEVEGVLIYPLVDRPISLDVKIHGHRFQLRTIDLASSWREIHHDLLEIVTRPVADEIVG